MTTDTKPTVADLKINDVVVLGGQALKIVFIYTPFGKTQAFITEDGIERRLPTKLKVKLVR